MKNTMLIWAILVLVVGTAMLLLRQYGIVYQENARLRQKQSELMASNATLRQEVNRLESQAKATEHAKQDLREHTTMLEQLNRPLKTKHQSSPLSSQIVAGQHESNPGMIPLRKENRDRLRFDAVNETFELTETL